MEGEEEEKEGEGHGHGAGSAAGTGGAAAAAAATHYSVRSQFGCQTHMTGLFRTQVENGIMGFSPQRGILPKLLHQQGLTRSSTFAMCLQVGGGFLSIGE